MTTLAICGGSLEKFATEIRSLQRTEIGELQEPFGNLQTGSSSMPHKKNPDITERICGLSRILRGNSLVALENISLWGERESFKFYFVIPRIIRCFLYSLTHALQSIICYINLLKLWKD